MRTVTTVNAKAPARERLPLKLALLFVGTFVVLLFVLVASTLVSTFTDSRRAADESEIQTPAITIDPKIQADLAKAMAFDAIPTATEVQNPFIDRANIGTNITVTGGSTVTNASTANSPTGAPGIGSRMTSVTRVSPTGPNIMLPSVDNTKARYDDWFNRVRLGYPTGPESETLGVDDLVPVGYADGGDRPPEVILFSISLCKTFSYPVGTRFYNGTLSEINPGEVVFAVENGIRRKSYASSQPCNADPSVGAGEMN
jgi:hypothetical protein